MSKIMNHLMIATIACFIGASSYAVAHEGDGKLGNVSFPISCKGEQAKFDRAVTLMPQLLSRDVESIPGNHPHPDCGIAYWDLRDELSSEPARSAFPRCNILCSLAVRDDRFVGQNARQSAESCQDPQRAS